MYILTSRTIAVVVYHKNIIQQTVTIYHTSTHTDTHTHTHTHTIYYYYYYYYYYHLHHHHKRPTRSQQPEQLGTQFHGLLDKWKALSTRGESLVYRAGKATSSTCHKGRALWARNIHTPHLTLSKKPCSGGVCPANNLPFHLHTGSQLPSLHAAHV